MTRSAFGLHLENTDIGIAATERQPLIPRNGSVTLLHMSLGREYPLLRQLYGPDLFIHCRCYHPNWYSLEPERWADECFDMLSGVPGFLDDPNTGASFENEQNLQHEGAPWAATWDRPHLAKENYDHIFEWQFRVRFRFRQRGPHIRTAILTGALADGHDVWGYDPDNEYHLDSFKRLLTLCDIVSVHSYAPADGTCSTPEDGGYWHLIRHTRPPRYRETVQGLASIGPWGDLGGVLHQYPDVPVLVTETGYFNHEDSSEAAVERGMRQLHNGLRVWSSYRNFMGCTMFIFHSDSANHPNRILHNAPLRARLPELHQYQACGWPKPQPQTGGDTVATFRVGNIDAIDLRTSLPQHPTLRYEARALGAIEQIVIHHSATDDDRSAQAIAEYHVNNNDWPGIGYQFLVHQDGRIEYCQGIEVVSYGVARRNDNTMHICLVGNWTSRAPGEVQLVAARSLIDNLCFALGRVYPIVGHTDIAPSDYATACPGATWSQWRGRLVDTVAPSVTDWQAEAEVYRIKAEAATADLAQVKTANENLRAYLTNIGRLAQAGLQKG